VLPDGAREDAEVVDQVGEVLPPLRDQLGDPAHVTVERAEAAQKLAQVLRLAVEALARADDQQAEVGARVAVERR